MVSLEQMMSNESAGNARANDYRVGVLYEVTAVTVNKPAGNSRSGTNATGGLTWSVLLIYEAVSANMSA